MQGRYRGDAGEMQHLEVEVRLEYRVVLAVQREEVPAQQVARLAPRLLWARARARARARVRARVRVRVRVRARVRVRVGVKDRVRNRVEVRVSAPRSPRRPRGSRAPARYGGDIGEI